MTGFIFRMFSVLFFVCHIFLISCQGLNKRWICGCAELIWMFPLCYNDLIASQSKGKVQITYCFTEYGTHHYKPIFLLGNEDHPFKNMPVKSALCRC